MLGCSRLFFGFLSLFILASLESAEFEVLRIDFELVKQEGGRDPWYEVAIVLSVERGETRPGANPRFADDVAVSLAIATEVPRQRGMQYEFYASRVEYPALEVGQHVVRFYLPPELVKRDRVKGEPFAFEIEVYARGEVLASFVSSGLRREPALQAFRSRIQSEASAVSALHPQRETPFAWAHPSDTPTPRLNLK